MTEYDFSLNHFLWSKPIMDFPSSIAGKSHFMRGWSWWILVWGPQSVLSQFVASTCPQIFYLLFAMHINDMYHRYAYVRRSLNDWVIKPKIKYDFSSNHFLSWKHCMNLFKVLSLQLGFWCFAPKESLLFGLMIQSMLLLNLWYRFIQHGLNFVPAWISKCIHYKVWDEITYSFPNFNSSTIDVWEWIINFILHFTVHAVTFPCEIYLIHVSKMGPR